MPRNPACYLPSHPAQIHQPELPNRVSLMKKLLSLTCLATILCLSACSSTAPYAALSYENDAEATSNVVVTNSDLRAIIRVGRAGVQRIEGTNQLKVIVPIRNISDREQQVRVQVSFLNLEKLPIGDDTNAQVQIIGPGATISHSVTSTMPEARDWVMRIVPNY